MGTMASIGSLALARDAFKRQAWKAARAAYAAAASTETLTLDDVEHHAIAAHLVGEESESQDALLRGYRESLRRDDLTRAIRFAFWLGHSHLFVGEHAQASGWFARARALLLERGVDCAEWGYLLIPEGIGQLIAGEVAAADRTMAEAQARGRRFADPDLIAMAGHGRGRALIRLGQTAEGMAALDEAMVFVTAGEVSPFLTGHVYCGVLEACQEVFDIRRAREWTAALTRWCEDQPDLVPYRGPCLVHRVELMRLRGDWQLALEEAQRACDWLSLPTSPESAADAFYELGELFRLRGDFSGADQAYRQASLLGRPPEPGLALLWLACGQAATATSALRRALAEAQNSAQRAELLAACVEALLAEGDIVGASEAADQLGDLAQTLDALLLQALSERARGSVLLAQGEVTAALAALRRSWTAWKQLDAPYEAARTRVLIGDACQSLGDQQSAAMEYEAARSVFDRLGAAADLARLDTGAPRHSPSAAKGLTGREVEVLSLIAKGWTNRAIADALVISEHTVARHVQNMLQKLGVSSRASLAAFAVEHGLIRPG